MSQVKESPTLETVHTVCGVCEMNNPQPFWIESGWHMVSCGECGHYYVDPRPSEDALAIHYEGYLPNEERGIDDWRRMMSRITEWTAQAIRGRVPPPANVLDIGCGFGFLLDRLREDGYGTRGIDLSSTAVEFAKDNDLDVSPGILGDTDFENETFDIVTAMYVIEHLPEPAVFLREVFRIMKPGGLLILRWPHTTPIIKIMRTLGLAPKLYDTPSHLQDFAPRTMARLLERTGYHDIQTTIGGFTKPPIFIQTLISGLMGGTAMGLAWLTRNAYLLPGVSKTTLALKPKSK